MDYTWLGTQETISANLECWWWCSKNVWSRATKAHSLIIDYIIFRVCCRFSLYSVEICFKQLKDYTEKKWLSSYPMIYLSVYLSIYPSIHASVSLSIDLSIYLCNTNSYDCAKPKNTANLIFQKYLFLFQQVSKQQCVLFHSSTYCIIFVTLMF